MSDKSVEQQARELLESMGVEHYLSAGDIVPLANLINENERLSDEIGVQQDEISRLRWAIDAVAKDRDGKKDENERLRAYIAELEAWHEKGAKLFDHYSVGLGAMFGLGKWWGERPWGKR
jgi:hypothetical protein